MSATFEAIMVVDASTKVSIKREFGENPKLSPQL